MKHCYWFVFIIFSLISFSSYSFAQEKETEIDTLANNYDIISRLESHPSFYSIRKSIESQGIFLNPIVSKSLINSDFCGFELDGNENNDLNFPTLVNGEIEEAKYYLLCNRLKTNHVNEDKLLYCFVSVVKYKTISLPLVILTDGHNYLTMNFNDSVNEKISIKEISDADNFLNNRNFRAISDKFHLIKCIFDSLGIDITANSMTDWASNLCSIDGAYDKLKAWYLLCTGLFACIPYSLGCPMAILNMSTFLACETTNYFSCMED